MAETIKDFESTNDAVICGDLLQRLAKSDGKVLRAARSLLDGETVVIQRRGTEIGRYSLMTTGAEAPSFPRKEG